MPDVQVEYRKLHDGQKRIYPRLGHRNVLRCGRRFGKTEFLETTFSRRAINGRKIGWFAPEYKLIWPTYARLRRNLAPLLKTSNKSTGFLELITGGSLEFWTLDNEDAGRSRDYDDVVIDEGSLKKTGLKEIVEQAISPTLLDRNGTLTMAGTPKGIDPENFFYLACQGHAQEKLYANDNPQGWREFYAPTRDNPMLDRDGVAQLEKNNAPLVYQQEYLAEFVDWSGASFFPKDKLLNDGLPIPYPTICDGVFAVVDTAIKTGTDNDGTAVVFFAVNHITPPALMILDWEIQQIEGSLLAGWLPQIFARCEELARYVRARSGAMGVWIEDKVSGSILLQQAIRMTDQERCGKVAHPIDNKLTSMGKDERALNISSHYYQEKIKISEYAYNKVMSYKGISANHFINQVCNFHVGDKEAAKRADDLLDCFCYGGALALGNAEGF